MPSRIMRQNGGGTFAEPPEEKIDSIIEQSSSNFTSEHKEMIYEKIESE